MTADQKGSRQGIEKLGCRGKGGRLNFSVNKLCRDRVAAQDFFHCHFTSHYGSRKGGDLESRPSFRSRALIGGTMRRSLVSLD